MTKLLSGFDKQSNMTFSSHKLGHGNVPEKIYRYAESLGGTVLGESLGGTVPRESLGGTVPGESPVGTVPGESLGGTVPGESLGGTVPGNLRYVRAITPFKVIQGHRVWYQSKAHMRLPISD